MLVNVHGAVHILGSARGCSLPSRIGPADIQGLTRERRKFYLIGRFRPASVGDSVISRDGHLWWL